MLIGDDDADGCVCVCGQAGQKRKAELTPEASRSKMKKR